MISHGLIFQPWAVRMLKNGGKTQLRLPVCLSTVLIDGHGYKPGDDLLGTAINWDDFLLNKAKITPRPAIVNIVPGRTSMIDHLRVPYKDFAPPFRMHPVFQKGDKIWVREKFKKHEFLGGVRYYADKNKTLERVLDGKSKNFSNSNFSNWKPATSMRLVDSRLDLEIVDVRIERLQGISEEDAQAEGVKIIADRAQAPVGTPKLKTRLSPTRPYTDLFKFIWDKTPEHKDFGWHIRQYVIALDIRVTAIKAGWDFEQKEIPE